jgi:hypothetical protein
LTQEEDKKISEMLTPLWYFRVRSLEGKDKILILVSSKALLFCVADF